MMKRLLFIMGLMLCSQSLFAQLYPNQYRPAGLNWQTLKTDHFRIIYPKGNDSLAYRAGQILEQQYPLVQDLIGGNLENFPMVLNDYNDLSNGFVAPFNFRSEIETPPIRGKLLNPRTGDWYESVLAHELVHAMHFSKKGGLTDIIGLFWPDARRIVHIWAPVGVHEGIAVYHESKSISAYEDGGRLNHGFFNGRVDANFASGDKWDRGQIFMTSDFTLPYNRHYLANSTFTQWLQEKYGEDITRRAIEKHYRSFLLGYGHALKSVTGKWPSELIDDFHEDYELVENGEEAFDIIDLTLQGEEINRPRWLDENRIIFNGRFYNRLTGLYSYDITDQKLNKEIEYFAVEDNNYDIRNDEVLIGRFKVDPLNQGVFQSTVSRLNLSDKVNNAINLEERAFGPAYLPNGDIVALKSYGADFEIIRMDQEGDVMDRIRIPDTRIFTIRPHPTKDLIAVIANRRGQQSLWISSWANLEDDLASDAIISLNYAAVYDPEWHPTEDKLLLSLDDGESIKIHEFDLDTKVLNWLVYSNFNTMEASWSPDGSKLAFVVQSGDERKLAIMNEEDLLYEKVNGSLLQSGNNRLETALLGEEISTKYWERENYASDYSWIKPRGFVPTLESVSGGDNDFQLGTSVFSTDVLGSHSYFANLSYFENNLWWDAAYRNTTFYPGFRLSSRRDPTVTNFGVRLVTPENLTTTASFTNIIDEQEYKFSIPLQYRWRLDTRLTSLIFEPGISYERLSFLNADGSRNSNQVDFVNLEGIAQLNVNLFRQRRDLQPSSGWVFVTQFESALNGTQQIVQNLNSPQGTISVQRNFDEAKALLLGATTYISPLRRLNQSLRLNVSFLTQTERLVFNTESLVPLGFDGDVFDNLDNNTIRYSARYVIPLSYPDQGGAFVPVYLGSAYLSLFTHTLGNFDDQSLLRNPRTIVGAGLRFRWKLSNVDLDIGFGFAFEPSRNQSQFIVGEF